MFVDNEIQNLRYAGYNPAFAQRVREQRRIAEREAAAAEMRAEMERREREREAARQLQIQILAARAEMESQERAERLERAKAFENEANITARQIIALVAAENGLTFDEVVSRSRTRRIVMVRKLAIAKVRADKPNMSLTQIGKIFDRDHTSILAALGKKRRRK